VRDLQSTNGVFVRLSPQIALRGYTRAAHDRFEATMLDESQDGTLPDETERNPGAPSERSRPRESAFHGGAFLEDQDLILAGQQVLRFEIVKEGASGMGPAYQHDTLLFGTPSSRRFARLCQRGVEGTTLDVYHLRKLETVMGREVGDLVFADDPFLSRTHAAVRVEEGPTPRFSLVDLGSSNGTFLRMAEAVEVFDGDQFRVGQQLFRIELPAGS
jgi:pSer/pThr/pTyr-binding forkhead associated (FHA) protein